MLFWSFCSIFLATAYAALMGMYCRGWRLLPLWLAPEGLQPRTRVSVVIPARNEAANIADCLESILNGSYPLDLLEIIVVDDHSEDATAAIVREFKRQEAKDKGQKDRILLLSLAEHLGKGPSLNSHKKKALALAIAHASGELIVTTDADCLAPPDWLRLIVAVFETRSPKIIAAPVVFQREKNLLQRFQSLDFLGLMGITGAGIRLGWQRLGNGANLAYPKAVFAEVGGFGHIDARASGDDLFLLQKVAKRWPEGVFFLKNADAAVRTAAAADWRAFFHQRLRWGTKNAALPEPGPKIALLIVFLFCWSILLNAVLVPFQGKISLALLAGQIAVKAACDFFFLREMCRFFDRRDLLRWFWPSFFLHVFYIAGVGLASLFFRRYEWKGRVVR